jgi:hypothetical protein
VARSATCLKERRSVRIGGEQGSGGKRGQQ